MWYVLKQLFKNSYTSNIDQIKPNLICMFESGIGTLILPHWHCMKNWVELNLYQGQGSLIEEIFIWFIQMLYRGSGTGGAGGAIAPPTFANLVLIYP